MSTDNTTTTSSSSSAVAAVAVSKPSTVAPVMATVTSNPIDTSAITISSSSVVAAKPIRTARKQIPPVVVESRPSGGSRSNNNSIKWGENEIHTFVNIMDKEYSKDSIEWRKVCATLERNTGISRSIDSCKKKWKRLLDDPEGGYFHLVQNIANLTAAAKNIDLQEPSSAEPSDDSEEDDAIPPIIQDTILERGDTEDTIEELGADSDVEVIEPINKQRKTSPPPLVKHTRSMTNNNNKRKATEQIEESTTATTTNTTNSNTTITALSLAADDAAKQQAGEEEIRRLKQRIDLLEQKLTEKITNPVLPPPLPVATAAAIVQSQPQQQQQQQQAESMVDIIERIMTSHNQTITTIMTKQNEQMLLFQRVFASTLNSVAAAATATPVPLPAPTQTSSVNRFSSSTSAPPIPTHTVHSYNFSQPQLTAPMQQPQQIYRGASAADMMMSSI